MTQQPSNPVLSAASTNASHNKAVDLAVCPVHFSIDEIIDGGEIATRV